MYESIKASDFYGEGLRRRRESAKIDREELGRLIGLSKWAIYDYENGRREPDVNTGIIMYNIISSRLAAMDNNSRAVQLGLMPPTEFSPLNPNDFYGFGLRIRREAAGLSVNDLAMALGVTRQTITRYENGTRNSGIHYAIVMSNIINDFLWHRMEEHAYQIIQNG